MFIFNLLYRSPSPRTPPLFLIFYHNFFFLVHPLLHFLFNLYPHILPCSLFYFYFFYSYRNHSSAPSHLNWKSCEVVYSTITTTNNYTLMTTLYFFVLGEWMGRFASFFSFPPTTTLLSHFFLPKNIKKSDSFKKKALSKKKKKQKNIKLKCWNFAVWLFLTVIGQSHVFP